MVGGTNQVPIGLKMTSLLFSIVALVTNAQQMSAVFSGQTLITEDASHPIMQHHHVKIIS